MIDIRAMAAVLGSSPMRPPTPLPSFRGLAPAAVTTPAPARRPAVRPSQTPLHVLLGVLVFGMVGLAGAVVHSATRTAPTVVVVEEVTSEPTRAAEAEEPGQAAAEEPEAEPEEEAAPPVAGKEPAPKRPRSASRTPDVARPVKPTPSVAPVKPTPAKEDPTSVACLLDPKSCATKTEAPAKVTPAAPPVTASDLPAKLEPSDISEGTRAAKAAALGRCAKLAKGGEVVKIKLSITGPSGSVLSAGAESDGGNAALASCAASELKAAQFKPVQKQQIGAVVTLKY